MTEKIRNKNFPTVTNLGSADTTSTTANNIRSNDCGGSSNIEFGTFNQTGVNILGQLPTSKHFSSSNPKISAIPSLQNQKQDSSYSILKLERTPKIQVENSQIIIQNSHSLENKSRSKSTEIYSQNNLSSEITKISPKTCRSTTIKSSYPPSNLNPNLNLNSNGKNQNEVQNPSQKTESKLGIFQNMSSNDAIQAKTFIAVKLLYFQCHTSGYKNEKDQPTPNKFSIKRNRSNNSLPLYLCFDFSKQLVIVQSRSRNSTSPKHSLTKEEFDQTKKFEKFSQNFTSEQQSNRICISRNLLAIESIKPDSIQHDKMQIQFKDCCALLFECVTQNASQCFIISKKTQDLIDQLKKLHSLKTNIQNISHSTKPQEKISFFKNNQCVFSTYVQKKGKLRQSIRYLIIRSNCVLEIWHSHEALNENENTFKEPINRIELEYLPIYNGDKKFSIQSRLLGKTFTFKLHSVDETIACVDLLKQYNGRRLEEVKEVEVEDRLKDSDGRKQSLFDDSKRKNVKLNEDKFELGRKFSEDNNSRRVQKNSLSSCLNILGDSVGNVRRSVIIDKDFLFETNSDMRLNSRFSGGDVDTSRNIKSALVKSKVKSKSVDAEQILKENKLMQRKFVYKASDVNVNTHMHLNTKTQNSILYSHNPNIYNSLNLPSSNKNLHQQMETSKHQSQSQSESQPTPQNFFDPTTRNFIEENIRHDADTLLSLDQQILGGLSSNEVNPSPTSTTTTNSTLSKNNFKNVIRTDKNQFCTLFLQVYTLFSLIRNSIEGGAFLTRNLFVSEKIWLQSGVKFTAQDLKVESQNYIRHALETMLSSLPLHSERGKSRKRLPRSSDYQAFVEQKICDCLTILRQVQTNLASHLAYIHAPKTKTTTSTARTKISQFGHQLKGLGHSIAKGYRRAAASTKKVNDISEYVLLVLEMCIEVQKLYEYCKKTNDELSLMQSQTQSQSQSNFTENENEKIAFENSQSQIPIYNFSIRDSNELSKQLQHLHKIFICLSVFARILMYDMRLCMLRYMKNSLKWFQSSSFSCNDRVSNVSSSGFSMNSLHSTSYTISK